MAISSIPSDIFRKAEETDIERIWQIIGQAKAQMQRLGSQQWDENYPAIEHIRQDIQDGNGYVICREDRVVAYGVISFDGEPVYKDIEGKWSNDLPYVIVHRLAIADEIARLQALAWWDWPDDKVQALLPLIQQAEVALLEQAAARWQGASQGE